MIEKHKYLFERLLPIIAILLLSGAYLIYKEKLKVQQVTIVAKSMIISHLKQDKSDSAILLANEKIKALDTEIGIDSLIKNIK
jgi:hypothetical protein